MGEDECKIKWDRNIFKKTTKKQQQKTKKVGGVTFDLDVLKVRVDAECQVARQSPWGGCPSNQRSGGVVKKREGNHHCGGVGGGGGM